MKRTIAEPIVRVIKRLRFQPGRILSVSERHFVLEADRNGRRVVVKATDNEAQFEQLRNEARTHQFLRSQTPLEARFRFPETETVMEQDGIVINVSEYLHGRWLGKKDPHRLARPITDEDLEDLFQVMLFLHHIKRDDVPEYFLKRSAKEFTLAATMKKHDNYLQPALGALISQREMDELQALMREAGYRRRFVHHDILPSNLLRQQDGTLVLTDAEFARWEMKWYDVAYTFLQVSLLYGDPVLGRRMLRYFVRRFKEELPYEDIEREIFFPLGYWIAANMFIAMKESEQRRRVRAMFERIMEQDVKLLCGEKAH